MNDYQQALKYFDKAIDKAAPDEDRVKHYWFHKGNCYLMMNDFDNAILSYNNSTLADDKYLEALNNRAVAFYKKNKKERAISELKNVLKIDYDYIASHHNLLKLNVNQPGYSSFWSYWMESLPKKIFAGLLISLISAIVLWVAIVPGIQSFIYSYTNTNALNQSKIETTTVSTLTGNNSIITTKNMTNEVKPLKGNQQNEIAIFPLISLGLLVLILLSPIIRSAKIGTTSLELTTIDRNLDQQLELEFIESR
jgi:hypothetical protein